MDGEKSRRFDAKMLGSWNYFGKNWKTGAINDKHMAEAHSKQLGWDKKTVCFDCLGKCVFFFQFLSVRDDFAKGIEQGFIHECPPEVGKKHKNDETESERPTKKRRIFDLTGESMFATFDVSCEEKSFSKMFRR